MFKSQPDFIATLKYRTTEEGGRTSYALSGYRPDIKFEFADRLTCGEQTFINKERVMPGDAVEAEIRMVGREYFANTLVEGMRFSFCEGLRTIGTGIIKRIINEELKVI